MTTFAAVSGYVGAAAFGVLVVLLLAAPRMGAIGHVLVAASTFTALWLLLHGAYYHFGRDNGIPLVWIQLLELARTALWLLFVTKLLSLISDEHFRFRIRVIGIGVCAVLTFALAAILAPRELANLLDMDLFQIRKSYLLVSLILALGGLILTEQLFRNTARDSRWALKHLCFGIGLMFAYDFYLFADAALFNSLDFMIRSARGLINALAVPMIAISIARNRSWDVDIFVSRKVVFHGLALLGAGIYLMTMAAAGYYIQVFGGEWGRALKTAFFCAAILVLLTLFFSAQLRSRLRLWLAKHFYRNKYEYGEEWLKFTERLAHTDLNPAVLNRTILSAVSDIVDSPGGVIWRKTPSGNFVVAAALSLYDGCDIEFESGAPFVTALERSGAVWNMTDDSDARSELRESAPERLMAMSRMAIIVPIVHREELLAFVALARPLSNAEIGWEDIDLLSTVGRQVASYFALVRATDALSEARQFEAFNRLSAFLVHDLKNVVAQLSLIESNAKKHRDNPEFVKDAFNTVGDAIRKMNRMLESLRTMQTEVDLDELVDVCEILNEAVKRMSGGSPVPRFAVVDAPVVVRAARDRLLSVVEHLLQNAIEATGKEGTIEVSLTTDRGKAFVRIEDSGCGMDREFINHRLFKPFDTTKGKAGMGIGAYESRHIVSSMNGELLVESEPGAGTTFTIVLPCAAEHDVADIKVAAQGI